jgi:hypothetical protein
MEVKSGPRDPGSVRATMVEEVRMAVRTIDGLDRVRAVRCALLTMVVGGGVSPTSAILAVVLGVPAVTTGAASEVRSGDAGWNETALEPALAYAER